MKKILLIAVLAPFCTFAQEIVDANGVPISQWKEVSHPKIDSFIGVPFGVGRFKIRGLSQSPCREKALRQDPDPEFIKAITFPRPFRSFKNGYVYFTENGNYLSYRVLTRCTFKDKNQATEEFAIVHNIIEEKYGIKLKRASELYNNKHFQHLGCLFDSSDFVYCNDSVCIRLACNGSSIYLDCDSNKHFWMDKNKEKSKKKDTHGIDVL